MGDFVPREATFHTTSTVGPWFRIRLRTLLSPIAPKILALSFVPHTMRKIVSRRRYSKDFSLYSQRLLAMDFTSGWFLSNYGKWRWFIERESLAEKSLRVLEIGSWEGMSAHFFLSHLSHAHFTAVDTWTGSEEHSVDPEELFTRFQKNINEFVDRLDVRRMTSDSFFESLATEERDFEPFDLIYIDGDHSVDQVRRDAENAWRAVADGGFVAFDDYLWELHPDAPSNPGQAINSFLRGINGQYRLVDCTSQILVQKVSSN